MYANKRRKKAAQISRNFCIKKSNPTIEKTGEKFKSEGQKITMQKSTRKIKVEEKFAKKFVQKVPTAWLSLGREITTNDLQVGDGRDTEALNCKPFTNL